MKIPPTTLVMCHVRKIISNLQRRYVVPFAIPEIYNWCMAQDIHDHELREQFSSVPLLSHDLDMMREAYVDLNFFSVSVNPS